LSSDDARPGTSRLPFVADIRNQPDALTQFLTTRSFDAVADVDLARWDRIVLTGMGASHYAAYPAWVRLISRGVAAWWLSTDELLANAQELIQDRTVVWMTSQSGQSAEIVRLISILEQGSEEVLLIGLTNDPASPLGASCDVRVDLAVGEEHTVGTRSYMNSVAAGSIVAESLVRGRVENAIEDIAFTIEGLRTYLSAGWDANLSAITKAVEDTKRLMIVSRGASLAAAWTGALTIKESANVHAEGMSAGQFRHGPLELADPDLTVIVIPDGIQSWSQDVRLLADLNRCGARSISIGPQPIIAEPTLPIADHRGVGCSIAQVVPLQMASIPLALASGYVPGEFRNVNKITTML